MDKPDRVFKSSEVYGKRPIEKMAAYTDPTWVMSVPIKDGMSILDVGCFKGVDVRQLWALYPNAKLTGVDIQKEAIEYCSKKHEDIGATWIVADVLKLPFADKEFDVVIANGLISDLNGEDVWAARAELKRVGQQVYIADYDSNLDFFREKLLG